MENLLAEMQERLKYLESLEITSENIGRINEISLAIVKIQQIYLKDISKFNDRRALAKKLYTESGVVDNAYNWHIWKRAFDLGWIYNNQNK